MRVKILHGGVVSDGAGGQLAAGAEIVVPEPVARSLVLNGHADLLDDETEVDVAPEPESPDLAVIEGADAPEEDPLDDPPTTRRRRKTA